MRKYTLHWTIHPEKSKEWYDAQKLRRSEDALARELDICYALSVSGRVFPSFKPERHISRERIPFNEHLPVYRIFDFGKVNCTLYIQRDGYARTRVLHERVLGAEDGKSNTKEQIRVALLESSDLFPNAHFIDICDPAGSYEDHRGEKPDVVQLEEEGFRPQFSRISELGTRDRKSRARKLVEKDLDEAPNGSEAFQIYVSPNKDKGCPYLEKALTSGYKYKTDRFGNVTDVIEEKHPHEDVMDCLFYYYLEADYYGDVADYDPEPYFNNDVNEFTGY